MPSSGEAAPPAATFYVHLEMVAETYLIVDFWNMFPDEIGRFFINRTRVKLPQDLKPQFQRKSVTQNDMESEARESVEDIMNVLIFNALSDPDFEKSVYTICNDPLPYYEQFRKRDLKKSPKKSIRLFSTSEKPRLSPVPIHPSDIDEDRNPTEMRTHPEGITVVEYMFDLMVYTILDEAQRGEFNLTARLRGQTGQTGTPAHTPTLLTADI